MRGIQTELWWHIPLLHTMRLATSLLDVYCRLTTEFTPTKKKKLKLECGPMPNVMAAQPNIGDARCESSVISFLLPRRKVWLTPAAGAAVQ